MTLDTMHKRTAAAAPDQIHSKGIFHKLRANAARATILKANEREVINTMAKKNFTNNPALQFITIPEETEQNTAPAPAPEQGKDTKPGLDPSRLDELRQLIPEGYTLTPIKEKRTKRIQLVLKPSIYEKLKAAADKAGISFNEYATQALIEKMEKENEE